MENIQKEKLIVKSKSGAILDDAIRESICLSVTEEIDVELIFGQKPKVEYFNISLRDLMEATKKID